MIRQALRALIKPACLPCSTPSLKDRVECRSCLVDGSGHIMIHQTFCASAAQHLTCTLPMTLVHRIGHYKLAKIKGSGDSARFASVMTTSCARKIPGLNVPYHTRLHTGLNWLS